MADATRHLTGPERPHRAFRQTLLGGLGDIGRFVGFGGQNGKLAPRTLHHAFKVSEELTIFDVVARLERLDGPLAAANQDASSAISCASVRMARALEAFSSAASRQDVQENHTRILPRSSRNELDPARCLIGS